MLELGVFGAILSRGGGCCVVANGVGLPEVGTMGGSHGGGGWNSHDKSSRV